MYFSLLGHLNYKVNNWNLISAISDIWAVKRLIVINRIQN